MANAFRPKEILREAELAEKAGNKRVASKLYHSLALRLSQKGKYREAQVLLDKAIELSKHSARLYVLKAFLTEKLGAVEECHEALKTFVRYSLEKGKLQEYIEYLETQLEALPKLRETVFEELLKLDRTTAFAFLGLARTCISLGNFEKAKTILIDCLKTRDQREKTIDLLRVVLQQMRSAQALAFLEKYQQGEMKEDELAVLLLGKKDRKVQVRVTDLEPGKDLQMLIRDLEAELGVCVEADLDSVRPLIHEFRKKAEAIIKDDKKTRIDFALAFYEMGLYQDAVEELKAVQVHDPLSAEAQSLLGRVFTAQGADLKALNQYQEVLRNGYSGIETMKDALYQLVGIYSRMNDLVRAMETAQRLEKLDPQYRDIHRLKINIEELLRH